MVSSDIPSVFKSLVVRACFFPCCAVSPSECPPPLWEHHLSVVQCMARCQPWHRAINTLNRWPFNTLRPRQDGRHFADDIFKCIFVNENVCISINISLKFIPKGPIDNIPALVEIMAWRRLGDKPLSEPMMVRLTNTYMCQSASMS